MTPERILLVDDSAAMRSFVRRVIRLAGFDDITYSEAANGQEALDAMRTSTPDLVLCDVNMPVMNGEQFLVALNHSGDIPRAPVLILSTDATETRVARMLELGAVGYLRKPFTPEQIRDALMNLSQR